MKPYAPPVMKGYCCDLCDGPESAYRRRSRKRGRKIQRREAKLEIVRVLKEEK